MPRPLIFISCGQVTDEEKKLGAEVCRLIKEFTPYEPYFAESQTTLEGLSDNILGALNRSSGLLAIMHPRGVVSSPSGGQHTRASVWIEQEIAIAAFMTQAQSRQLPVLAYIHKDIKREGVRDNLLLNARTFVSNEDILEHLKSTLPTWRVEPPVGSTPVELAITYKKLVCDADHHNYRLTITLKNLGTEVIDSYHMDVLFPTAFLFGGTHGSAVVPIRRTDTHSCIRVSSKTGEVNALYPGDLNTILTIDYYMNRHLFKTELLSQNVTATLYVEGKPPLVVEKSMSELQVF
jgi:hypothetical protein